MAKLVKGNVVVVNFPFSDLSQSKRRPALVVAKAEFTNLILCQITAQPYTSKQAIPITSADFVEGNLVKKSYIRPDKLFTTDASIIERTIGKIKKDTLKGVLLHLRELFSEDA